MFMSAMLEILMQTGAFYAAHALMAGMLSGISIKGDFAMGKLQ